MHHKGSAPQSNSSYLPRNFITADGGFSGNPVGLVDLNRQYFTKFIRYLQVHPTVALSLTPNFFSVHMT